MWRPRATHPQVSELAPDKPLKSISFAGNAPPAINACESRHPPLRAYGYARYNRPDPDDKLTPVHARALAPDNVFVAGPCLCADALPETIGHGPGRLGAVKRP